MKLKLFSSICIFFAANIMLSAQSTAAEMETILNTPVISYAQAARFALEASNKLVTRDRSEAFRFVQEKTWIPLDVEADQDARLDHISKLLLNAFDMKGGLFYRLTESPHYAYREMEYHKIIQGRTEPSTLVSGELFLFMISRLMPEHERREALAAERAAREAEEAARRAQQEAEEAEIRAMEEAAAAAEAERAAVPEPEPEPEPVIEPAAEPEPEPPAPAAEPEIEVPVPVAEIPAPCEQAAPPEMPARTVRPEPLPPVTLPVILFDTDSALFKEEELVKLQEIVEILKKIPNVKIQIDGHAALAGSRSGQSRIANDRIRAVAAYLVLHGACEAANITRNNYAARRPVATNSTEEGMKANRRVEITITGGR